MSLIVVVVTYFDFRGLKGLSTFFVNKVNIFSFLFGSSWNPAAKEFGALPMILGSFIVTLLSPSGQRRLPLVQLFSWQKSPQRSSFLATSNWAFGGDSFSCLRIYWPSSRCTHLRVVSLVGLVLGFSQGLCPFVMILPTVTFMTTDSLRAVPPSLPGG